MHENVGGFVVVGIPWHDFNGKNLRHDVFTLNLMTAY
jgi:hypothetical protein